MSIPRNDDARHRFGGADRDLSGTGSPDRLEAATMSGAPRKTSALPSVWRPKGARTSKGLDMSLPHSGAGFKARAPDVRAALPVPLRTGCDAFVPGPGTAAP